MFLDVVTRVAEVRQDQRLVDQTEAGEQRPRFVLDLPQPVDLIRSRGSDPVGIDALDHAAVPPVRRASSAFFYTSVDGLAFNDHDAPATLRPQVLRRRTEWSCRSSGRSSRVAAGRVTSRG